MVTDFVLEKSAEDLKQNYFSTDGSLKSKMLEREQIRHAGEAFTEVSAVFIAIFRGECSGEGILLTVVDGRTNLARGVGTLLQETYGGKIKVFQAEVPHSVREKVMEIPRGRKCARKGARFGRIFELNACIRFERLSFFDSLKRTQPVLSRLCPFSVH